MYSSSFVFYVVLTRILTQAEVGAVSLLLFSHAALQTIATLSMPIAVAKYVSERERGLSPPAEVVKAALKVLLCFTTPCIALLIVLSPSIASIMNYKEFSVPLAIAFATAYLLGYAQVSYSILWGIGGFREMLIASVGYVLVGKVLALVFASLGFGVLGVSVGFLIGSMLFFALGWIYACRLVLLKYGGEGPRFPVKTLLSYSLPLVFSSSIMIAQRWADVLVLYALTSDLSSTGIYYLSASSAWILSMVWNAVAIAAFPKISLEWARSNLDSLRQILSQTLRLMSFLAISAGFVGASLASLGMEIAYGRGYLAGASPLALLLVFSFIPAWNAILNYCLRALGKTATVLKAAIGGVAVELFSMVLLVKPFGMVGAAASRVLMTAALFTAYYLGVKRYVGIGVDRYRLGKIVAFATLVAIPVYAVDYALLAFDVYARLAADLVVVVAAGFLAGLLLKPLAREDSKLLLEISPSSAKPILSKVAPMISS